MNIGFASFIAGILLVLLVLSVVQIIH